MSSNSKFFLSQRLFTLIVFFSSYTVHTELLKCNIAKQENTSIIKDVTSFCLKQREKIKRSSEKFTLSSIFWRKKQAVIRFFSLSGAAWEKLEVSG